MDNNIDLRIAAIRDRMQAGYRAPAVGKFPTNTPSELTVEVFDGFKFAAEIYATEDSGPVIVDWGDGNIEEFAFNSSYGSYNPEHTYAVTKIVNISISKLPVAITELALTNCNVTRINYIAFGYPSAINLNGNVKLSASEVLRHYTIPLEFDAEINIEGLSDLDENAIAEFLQVNPTSAVYYTVPDEFVSKWNCLRSQSIALPLDVDGEYDFEVDWGDGSPRNHITAYNDSAVTHTYTADGDYIVTIIGKCWGWRFANAGSKTNLLEVNSWGSDFRLGNKGQYFEGCVNLRVLAYDAINMTGTTNLRRCWYGCTSLDNRAKMDTSGVTDFNGFLGNCTSYDAPVNDLNTASATTLYNMFGGCTIFNQPVSNFDTRKVQFFGYMFYRNYVFNQSVSNFKTTAATSMVAMFNDAQAFNQSLASFNTESVTDFSYFLRNCYVFDKSISHFDASSCTTLRAFAEGALLLNCPLPLFNTRKVTIFKDAFRNCPAFKQDISNLRFDSVVNPGCEGILTDTPLDEPGTTTNYDKLLIAIAAQPVIGDIFFDAQSCYYGPDAQTAHDHLTVDLFWAIEDAGLITP